MAHSNVSSGQCHSTLESYEVKLKAHAKHVSLLEAAFDRVAESKETSLMP